jgi:hypothetical protein
MTELQVSVEHNIPSAGLLHTQKTKCLPAILVISISSDKNNCKVVFNIMVDLNRLDMPEMDVKVQGEVILLDDRRLRQVQDVLTLSLERTVFNVDLFIPTISFYMGTAIPQV